LAAVHVPAHRSSSSSSSSHWCCHMCWHCRLADCPANTHATAAAAAASTVAIALPSHILLLLPHGRIVSTVSGSRPLQQPSQVRLKSLEKVMPADSARLAGTAAGQAGIGPSCSMLVSPRLMLVASITCNACTHACLQEVCGCCVFVICFESHSDS
jgi:hypothetical protein